jgi:cytidine deaminase
MSQQPIKKVIHLEYDVFQSLDHLQGQDQALMVQARKTLVNAYAPYSGFYVSAALRFENGVMITGTNQENAAYGLCICAEQNVLSTAGSNYKDLAIEAIAITAQARDKTILAPVFPCGACRQSISEHEDRHLHPIRVLLQGEKGEVFVFKSIKDLLPWSFSQNDLL